MVVPLTLRKSEQPTPYIATLTSAAMAAMEVSPPAAVHQLFEALAGD
jgi:hypothetical protein